MTFEGVRPVLHIPFADEPGQPIIERELSLLAERMLDHGVDGLAVPQLASETWALLESERDRVIAIAAEACAGRAPLVVGLDGTTAVAEDRARRAAKAGAAGLMVLPPRQAVSPDQVIDHYSAVADAGGIPLMVQDSPQVTGVQLGVETLSRLRERHPLIVAVKSEIPRGRRQGQCHRCGRPGARRGLGRAQLPRASGPRCRRLLPGLRPGTGHQGYRCGRVFRRAARRAVPLSAILPYLSLATASLDLLLLTAKRHLRRSGVFSTEILRAPARTLDEREASTVDALLDELAAAGAPGF